VANRSPRLGPSLCKCLQQEGRDYIYTHLVFHFGYFLERYGCLERFANFGIENMHACNKRVIISATNGFAGLDEGQSTLAKQLLTHSRRVRAFRAASASRGDLSSAFEAALNSWVLEKLRPLKSSSLVIDRVLEANAGRLTIQIESHIHRSLQNCVASIVFKLFPHTGCKHRWKCILGCVCARHAAEDEKMKCMGNRTPYCNWQFLAM